MRQCNKCETKGCRIIESVYPKFRSKHRLSREELMRDCSSYTSPEPFKIPLLLNVLDNQGADIINKLLTQYKISFQEKDRYPYFILDHKKHGRKKNSNRM